MSSPLSRAQHRLQWSRLHGGVEPRGLVRWWLDVAYALGSPLARARVPADVVTVLGGAVAAAAAWSAWRGAAVVAGLLALLSGLLDGIDGTVAVLRGTTRAWGALLDAVVDRVADALLLLALWAVGAPAAVCLAAGILGYLLEYARARAGALGVTAVGVLTVGERPTRVLVVGMFLLAAGVRPEPSTWVSVGAWVLFAVGAVALVQLLVVLRRRLG